VAPEFERIQHDLQLHGAKGSNPLTLERDPPEPGAVYVLLYDDLLLPYIRVTVADKPNPLPWPSEKPRDYPEPRFFDPVRDSSTFLGWSERGSMATSVTSGELVTMILELAMKE
jgi:hypothetical protein